MGTIRTAVLAVLAVGISGGLGAAPEARPGVGERLARLFSREVRDAEERLKALTGELKGLPALRTGPRGSRYGFHSGTIFEQEEPHWVQLDLGRSCAIDGIVAMPVHIPTIETHGEGYGFPLRFKIEVADDPGMEEAVVVVDRTAADVENPGRYPLVFRPDVVTGRYVRFTSTKHVASEEGFIWAMEELMVLSGNRNVAKGSAASASSLLELYPNWAVARINDLHSALGLPVTSEPSPSDGYLSAPFSDERTEKWLVVDLGREFEIEEVRLLAVESDDYEVVGGRGYPKEMVVELSADPGFGEVAWRRRRSSNHLGAPWGNPTVVPGEGGSGRYLRVMATHLWARVKLHSFALAEVQVYAGGENVAFGKPVRAKDEVDKPGSTRWAPKFVVDGFTSRHRLIEIPEYLDLIVRRGGLEREQAMLRDRRDRKVRQVATTLGGGGGGLGGVALLGWLWMLVRQKTVRRRAMGLLREQIARDLHDDIGSNLGGIVLLSEMGSRHRGIDEELRHDFMEIKKTAEETTESMQDIVWLIEPGSMGLQELVLKMRKSVEMIVGTLAVSVVVEPPEFRNRQLSLLFRRHLFFAFKEALNNVRRHAEATSVEVRIEIFSGHLAFTVRDDGVGFDPGSGAGSGHGLANLRRRADRLKGTCELQSEPGRGTTVRFKAPLMS
jgi:signal transduction histidine kinase